MGFAVGEIVGPYQILEHIGQGGMASIYRARDLSLDRDVALKILHPALNQDPSFEIRLNREASIVAQLHHPGIVAIYDHGQHEGTPYLVMRYIPGKTLKAILQERTLGTDEILHIARSVGDALAYAHANGVLHRDVKPSNILIDDAGRVFLTDFGLARLVCNPESTLSHDMLIGSPHYISPEQAKGEQANERSDIYSFGVVLFEMFTGRVPFAGETPLTTIMAHINEPLPSPRSLNERIPEAVELVLEKALAKDPAQRFASIGEMVSALENGAQGLTASEAARSHPLVGEGQGDDSPPKQDRRPEVNHRDRPAREAAFGPAIPHEAMSRIFGTLVGLIRRLVTGARLLPHHKAWSWLALALLTLCVLIAGLWGIVWARPRTAPAKIALVTSTLAPEPVSVMFPTLTLEPSQTPTMILTVVSIPPSPTPVRPPATLLAPTLSPPAVRGKIAYSVAYGDLPEMRSIWIANSDGGNPRQIIEMAMWPSLSPDGKQVAYYRIKDSGIYIANSDGGNPHKVLGFADTCCVQWSPDSKQLVYFRGNPKFGGSIFTATIDGKNITEIASGFNPAWSPDGNKIIYANCQENTSHCGLFVLDLKTKAGTMITRDNGANPQWSPRGDKIVYQKDDGNGHVNVFLVKPDGTGVKQLTSGKGNDGQPTWSRDGNLIFWRSDQNGKGWSIFAMNADGTRPRLVIPNTPPDPERWGRESLTASP